MVFFLLKNKGNFVFVYSYSTIIIATSHAHNFLPLTCESKLLCLDFSERGLCTVSYNIIPEDSLWKCFRLESLVCQVYIAHVCSKQLEVCV